jgi:hypothetical protein
VKPPSYHWERVKIKGEIRGKPEWSAVVRQMIESEFVTLDFAKDIADFCPTYRTLGESERIDAWAEFWIAVAYFESLWNPRQASVDVGKPDKRDTWSVGLWQMSVVDQSWLLNETPYKYEDLLEVEPNARLSLTAMRRQLMKADHKIVLPNSSKYRYWAVLLQGNRYNKIAEIKVWMKKYVPLCGG